TIDHVGIYLLIAGTVTPPAAILLHGRWRQGTLFGAWCLAGLGIGLQLAWPTSPAWVYTLIYLSMGWGLCLGYFEMARVLPTGGMRPIWLGGLLYSIGALINMADWPNLAPGILGAHELWHVFAIMGSFCHFWFMVRWVAPFERRCAVSALTLTTPVPVTPRAAATLSLSTPLQ